MVWGLLEMRLLDHARSTRYHITSNLVHRDNFPTLSSCLDEENKLHGSDLANKVLNSSKDLLGWFLLKQHEDTIHIYLCKDFV